MAKKVYGFSESKAKKLGKIADEFRLASSNSDSTRPINSTAQWVAQAVTTITQAYRIRPNDNPLDERVLPGSGTIRIGELDRGSYQVEPHLPAGESMTSAAYSLLPFAVPQGRWVYVIRDLRQTLWVIGFADILPDGSGSDGSGSDGSGTDGTGSGTDGTGSGTDGTGSGTDGSGSDGSGSDGSGSDGSGSDGSGTDGSGSDGTGTGTGSGSGCISLVTNVYLDSLGQLIVCSRTICFPPGTTIGDQTCDVTSTGSDGSGGSGSGSTPGSGSCYGVCIYEWQGGGWTVANQGCGGPSCGCPTNRDDLPGFGYEGQQIGLNCQTI